MTLAKVLHSGKPDPFKKLIYWNEVDKGGLFVANEQPQIVAEELRAAFGSLRQSRDKRAG